MWRVAQLDNNARVISVQRTSVFFILIGGPGVYEGKDTAHDKSWYSYIDPVLQENERGKLALPNEEIYWCLYAPAYVRRWNSDVIKPGWWENNIRDSDLSLTRYGHTQKVIAAGAKDYLDYIKMKAKAGNAKNPYKVRVVEINSAAEFWQNLEALALHTLNRVWFCGHAAGDLWLTLYHEGAVAGMLPANEENETIQQARIADHANLKDRFVPNPLPCKFYGCNTNVFAETWWKQFGVPAEGAAGKVNFQREGFTGIESSATLGWQKYP